METESLGLIHFEPITAESMNLRQVSGEIALRVGDDGAYFGVISIGDTATLMKNCALKGIVTHTEEFASESLFRSINTTDSGINVLIGSRKFTEGWNSWRVSTMGLINFAKGEGSQAIQLFGRGVRLHGYNGCLKRSRKLDDRSVKVPQYLELLETLTIFGIKAQYMEDFKKYLEMEDMPSNETVHEFRLPVINRYNDVKDKKLRVIRVKDGANFKKQSKRLILDVPDAGFMRYLNKSKTVIDCRGKVQTIESEGTIQRQAMTEEHTLDKAYLPMLDYQRIFVELEQYKNEKLYYNISLVKEKFLSILQQDGWYSLIIPESHIRINSIQKLESATDYAVMVLKSYIDKFFKYEKERWEAPLLEYQELQINDNNFVDEYTFSYTDINENDTGAEQVEKFVADLRDILNKHSGIPDYEKDMVHGQLVAFDFRKDVYYYACKHRMTVDGHRCDYHRQWQQAMIDSAVLECIVNLVSDPALSADIQARISQNIDVSALQGQLDALKAKERKVQANKRKYLNMLESLDEGERNYQIKLTDYQARVDAIYDELADISDDIATVERRIEQAMQDRLTEERVFKSIEAFSKIHNRMNDLEKKEFVNAIVSKVEIYPERLSDGRILKYIEFKLPVFYDSENGWDTQSTVETVCLLNKE